MVRILFPTDFSSTASNAFRYACGLAQLINGKIDVVYIYHSETMGGSMLRLKDIKDTKKVIHNRLINKIDTFIGEGNEAIISDKKIIFGDSVAEGIVSSAVELNTDLIVMGIKSSHNLFEKLFGSITSDVIVQTPIPLFIVPENALFKTIKKMAYATNFEKGEKDVLIKLEKWAGRFGVSVKVVHIGKDSSQKIINVKSQKEYDRFGGIHMVDAPSVLVGLNDFVNKHEIDLLGFFKPKRNFLKNLAHTSQSRNIIFNADLPIFVFTNIRQATSNT